MTLLTVFTPAEQIRFDSPPCLTKKDKIRYFSFTDDIKTIISSMRSDTNKIGFLLQLGYFQASGKFFKPTEYRKLDISHVAKLLSIDPRNFNDLKYSKKTKITHRDRILKLQGWTHFHKKEKARLISEIDRHVKNQLHPKQLLHTAINYLITNKIELPSYHCMIDIITNSFNNFEIKLFSILEKKLTKEHLKSLDHLLGRDPNEKSSCVSIKNINQSLRPTQIKSSVEVFNLVKQTFLYFQPIIFELNLSEQATEYYSVWVKKASKKQLNTFPNKLKSYLYLLAFIKHQYYIRHDMLTDILIKSVTTIKNRAIKKAKKINREQKKERNELVLALTKNRKSSLEVLKDIDSVTESKILNDSEKLKKISRLIECYKKFNSEIEDDQVAELEEFVSGDNNKYYKCLENESMNLQRRVSCVLQALTFDKESSKDELFKTVRHYQEKSTKITKTAPADFLNEFERKTVFKPDKFNVSLYKSLLFINVANNIKSGKLNLTNSYRYLSIYNYLIDKETWTKNKKGILKKYGLIQYYDSSFLLEDLKKKLESLFCTVNNDCISGKNKYLSFNKNGNAIISTPAIDSDESEFISHLLSKNNNQTPIFELLTDINKVVSFTKNFKHHSLKNSKLKLKEETIFAGIIGKGCNIGIPKMAGISKGITLEHLKNTVTWCFSLKNIQEATNDIISFIHKLSLSEVFCDPQGDIHTSSDGQKINVGVDSLLSSYSFKYFGKGKGVSIYTFIDDRQSLFYSTVISASEREAAYVIDGLLHNDVVKSSIHSTDTHGYTETIFGATYLLDIAFAPRIKSIGKQALYSFHSKKHYENKAYKILPKTSINKKIIRENWDDVLRFIATIKTKHVPASYLFKRLSSYAKDQKLYQALKEFGRINKSISILTYYSDVEFRQRIEKQLNRIEQSNKFSNAIFFANARELKVALKEDQELVIACKVLMQNAIILWNYLSLSQIIVNNKNVDERNEIIKMISVGSVLTWGHINLQGEYDFTRRASNDKK